MTIVEKIDELEHLARRVDLPWTATENVGFYVNVTKPRESNSKHDRERPTYWYPDDGHYLLACANWMPEILEYIGDLEDRILELGGRPE